jgi:acetyl esterase/lipase
VVWSGVPCLVCSPPRPRSIALHLHGGGFRLGGVDKFVAFASRVAAEAQATVVLVDYALAPEEPFPGALHDAATVYEHVVEAGHDRIILMGDSAGGGLAASLVVAIVQAGIAGPAGLVLLSPWLDLGCSGSTYDTRAATDVYFSLAAAREAADMYLQGFPVADPHASPARAWLPWWPPALVFASTDEVLLDDSLAFCSTLAREAVDVTAHFVPGVTHVWPTLAPDSDEGRRVIRAIAAFIDQRSIEACSTNERH